MSYPKFISFGISKKEGYMEFFPKVIIDTAYSSPIRLIVPICIVNTWNKRIYIKLVNQNPNYSIDPEFPGYVDPDNKLEPNVTLTRSSEPNSYPFEEEIAILVEGYEDSEYTQKVGDALIDIDVYMVNKLEQQVSKLFNFDDGTLQGISHIGGIYEQFFGVTSEQYLSPSYSLKCEAGGYYYGCQPGWVEFKIPMNDLEPGLYVVSLDVKPFAKSRYGGIAGIRIDQVVNSFRRTLLYIDTKIAPRILPIGKWRTIALAVRDIDGNMGELRVRIDTTCEHTGMYIDNIAFIKITQ